MILLAVKTKVSIIFEIQDVKKHRREMPKWWSLTQNNPKLQCLSSSNWKKEEHSSDKTDRKVSLRPIHTAAITKTITITRQREHIILVEWACAYSAWSNSTNRLRSPCVVIVIVFVIAAVWLGLYSAAHFVWIRCYILLPVNSQFIEDTHNVT